MLPSRLPDSRRAPLKCAYMAALLCFLFRRFAPSRFPRKVSRPVASIRCRASKLSPRPSSCTACTRAVRPPSTNSTSQARQPSMTTAPAFGGAPDQDLVELRASHLIGQRLRFIPGVREFELLVPAVPGRHELRAPLLHADGAYLFRDSQAFEYRQIGGQQRLADVEPGVTGLLQAAPRSSPSRPAQWPRSNPPGRRRPPTRRRIAGSYLLRSGSKCRGGCQIERLRTMGRSLSCRQTRVQRL